MSKPKIVWKLDAPGARARRYATFAKMLAKVPEFVAAYGSATVQEINGWSCFVVTDRGEIVGKYSHKQAQGVRLAIKGAAHGHTA